MSAERVSFPAPARMQPREIYHVYPLAEEREHVFRWPARCWCQYEIRWRPDLAMIVIHNKRC